MTRKTCDWCEDVGGDLVRRTHLADDRPVWVHFDCLTDWEAAQIELANMSREELLRLRDWNESR
jgi:hypothetical protein